VYRLDGPALAEWRNDPKEQCSFCLREKAVVDHLVAGPNTSICSNCAWICQRLLVTHRMPGWKRWWDPRPTRTFPVVSGTPYRDADVACSFCGLSTPETTIAAVHARICAACVRLVMDVLVEAKRPIRQV
jgi:ClpX C4-type zinc finger protein